MACRIGGTVQFWYSVKQYSYGPERQNSELKEAMNLCTIAESGDSSLFTISNPFHIPLHIAASSIVNIYVTTDDILYDLLYIALITLLCIHKHITALKKKQIERCTKCFK